MKKYIMKWQVKTKMHEEKDEMALINTYTRKELSQNDVYTFSITLCDNEIDRDFEVFTKEALYGLATLFLGKTGIFDHNMKASAQSARIYKTWIEEEEGRLTSYGETYCCLKAKAYMVRTQQNKCLIDEIEGGIKKEVSVSCQMEKMTCSVCGKELRTHACEHIKGKKYSGKLCFGILSCPVDAYEWSFVAVPAQRQAGVTKAFFKEENMSETLDIIKSASSGVELSALQVKALKEQIETLERESEDAKNYRNFLKSEIYKYALIVMPDACTKEFLCGCESMNAKQLESFRNGLQKQAEQVIPPTVQLKGQKSKNTTDNKAYTI